MKFFKPPIKKVDFSSIVYEPLGESIYVKPISMFYQENHKNKKWDIVKSFDSVSILLFDSSKQAFVIVRQFRPAVFFNNPKDGYTYELCAGLADKNKSLGEIASEEVLEECGYKILPSQLHFIGSFLNSTGMSGSKQFLYFAEVNDACRVNDGGGIEDECIEVLYLSLEDSLEFIFDESFQKTTSLFLGIHWYHYSYKSKGKI